MHSLMATSSGLVYPIRLLMLFIGSLPALSLGPVSSVHAKETGGRYANANVGPTSLRYGGAFAFDIAHNKLVISILNTSN